MVIKTLKVRGIDVSFMRYNGCLQYKVSSNDARIIHKTLQYLEDEGVMECLSEERDKWETENLPLYKETFLEKAKNLIKDILGIDTGR